MVATELVVGPNPGPCGRRAQGGGRPGQPSFSGPYPWGGPNPPATPGKAQGGAERGGTPHQSARTLTQSQHNGCARARWRRRKRACTKGPREVPSCATGLRRGTHARRRRGARTSDGGMPEACLQRHTVHLPVNAVALLVACPRVHLHYAHMRLLMGLHPLRDTEKAARATDAPLPPARDQAGPSGARLCSQRGKGWHLRGAFVIYGPGHTLWPHPV